MLQYKGKIDANGGASDEMANCFDKRIIGNFTGARQVNPLKTGTPNNDMYAL